MVKHFDVQPAIWHAERLVFDWDQEAGVVSGPGAAYITAVAARGEISAHPLPWSHKFSAEPLKSAEDLAAIVGLHHRLPESLAAHYPRPVSDDLAIIEPPGLTQ